MGQHLKWIVLLVLTTLSYAELACAQYLPGYVVTIEKDTLKGFILHQDFSDNNITCSFKPGPQDQAIKYDASEILEFRYSNGDKVVSGEAYSLGKTGFLRQIIAGTINIFYDGQTYTFGKAGSLMDIKSNEKVTKLRSWLLDCPEMEKSIHRVKMTDLSLIQHFKEYNESCFKKPNDFFYPGIYKKDIFLGISIAQLIVSTETENDINVDGLGLEINILAEKRIPTLKNHWLIAAAIGYQLQQLHSFDEMTITDTRIKFSAFTIDLGVKAMVRLGKLSAFAHPGGNIYFPINAHSTIYEQTLGSQVVTTSLSELRSTTEPGFSGFLGIGVCYNKNGNPKAGVELKFENGDGIGSLGTTKIMDLSVFYFIVPGKQVLKK